MWEKRLFTAEDPDPVPHLRPCSAPTPQRLPWGGYAVRLRGWLRAHPDQVTRYEDMRLPLAREHAGDPDFDDHTRAKPAYFDEVQPHLEASAKVHGDDAGE